ncbi:hypothetical protein K449DRAFT_396890 [Hypoxylon sp. EC38]|nr:hypothetical protein K449DRAFT_396890 [Hypoxylon sp. EC38]
MGNHGDKKEETPLTETSPTCSSSVPSCHTHCTAGGTQGAESGTQPSTNPEAPALQGNTSSASSSYPTSSSGVYVPSSGGESESVNDNDSDIASSLEDVDLSDVEIGVARTVNYVHVGPARLVDIPPRSTSNQQPSEPSRDAPEPSHAGVTQAGPRVGFRRPRLAAMLSFDDLRHARTASSNVGPSHALPPSATSPALNQPLPVAPSADPLAAYVEQDKRRIQNALRRYERRYDELLQENQRQRQINEAMRHQMNVDRAQYERRQLNKSISTPQMFMVPNSDGGDSTGSSTSASHAGPSNAQDAPPTYEYERQIRRMGGMLPLKASTRSMQNLPLPPVPPSPARLGELRLSPVHSSPIRPLPNSNSFSSVSSGSSRSGRHRFFHSSRSSSASPSRPHGSPGGRMISAPSRLNPNRYPPLSLHHGGNSGSLTISEPHRLSIVPELAEEMAETSSNNDTPWARAAAVILAQLDEARPRILAQVSLFVPHDAEAMHITETILARDDEVVNECAYGEGSVNAIKEIVENLKIGFQVLKGTAFGACDEDFELLIKARLRRKVQALADKIKAEEEEAAKNQGKGKEKEEGGRGN